MEMPENMAAGRLKDAHTFGSLRPPFCKLNKWLRSGFFIKEVLNTVKTNFRTVERTLVFTPLGQETLNLQDTYSNVPRSTVTACPLKRTRSPSR